MKKLLFVFVVWLCLLTGCGQAGFSSGLPVVSDLSPEVAGSARLNLAFELPDSKLSPAIRAAGGGAATVTAVISVVVNGKVSMIRRQVSVIDGTAVFSFNSLPEGSALGEFLISGGHLAGYSDFHGAIDLGAGENTMVTSPVGCGMDSDLLATVFQQVIQSRTMIEARSSNLVALVSGMVAEFRQQTITTTLVQTSVIFEKLVNLVRPAGLVTVKPSLDRSSIAGYDNTDSLIWTKSSSQIFANSLELANVAVSMQISHVIRQGLNGSAYIAWKQNTGEIFAITRINAVNGETQAIVINPGDCFAEAWQSESGLIVGGYHSVKKCPVVFRWDCTTNASTGLIAGSAGQGLVWCKYFTEFAASGKSPTVVRLSFIATAGLKAVIDDAAGSRVRYLDIDASTGLYELPTSSSFSLSASPGYARVTLNWLANPGSVYDLYWGNTADITQQNANHLTDVSSPYRHDFLNNSTEYHYFLVEKKADGTSFESFKVTAIPSSALNQKPMIAIVSPQPQQSFILGAAIVVNTQTSDDDGEIASVSLYVDDKFYERVAQAPFSFTVTGLSAGIHNLYAVVSDNHNAVARSGIVEIKVLSEITGQDFAGRITGHLKDDHTSLPISGALIGIAGTSVQTVTDNTGYFALESLAPGIYDLVIKRDGYATRTVRGIKVS